MASWRKCLPIVFLVFTGLVNADDFKALRKEYEDAKARSGGVPEERLKKVQKSVLPILEKIGAVDSNESLGFLLGELKSAGPEVAAACAGPILASSNDGAPKLLLQQFSDKNRPVAIGILDALSKTKRDLVPLEAELIHLAQGVHDLEVKKAIPPVLGKLDSLAAAKALFFHVQAGKAVKGEDPQHVYNSRVVTALKLTKKDEVKKWLAGPAFLAAGPDAAKLAVVARLSGELSLVDARGELEKLVGHSAKDVSTAAVASLGKVGLGGSAEGIAEALEKRKGKGDVAFRIQALDSLAKTGTDQGLDVVLRFAQGDDPEMRAAAMGSLALCKGNPRALQGILRGLDDADPSVRAVALRVVAGAGIRDKAVIGPLIGFLGKEKEDRLKINAAELLAGLTGQGQMGLVHEDWEKWWDGAEAKFEFPKEGDKAITNVKAQRKIDLSYFGIEVSSKKLCFVVDCSSSMLEMVAVKSGGGGGGSAAGGDEEKADGKTTVGGGEDKGSGGGGDGGGGLVVKDGKARKIDVLKKELARLLKKLPPDTQINILTFNRTFTAWQTQLQPLAGSGRTKAVQHVENLKTGTGTNVFDTLEAALKDKRVDTIYLLTDGLPTAGRLIEKDAILKEIQAQNRIRGATIHCIAFGEESPLLKDLAPQNGGKYRFVNSY